MEYILKLGNVDVSQYVESGYKTDIEPVYDSGTYENMFGQDKAKLIGTKISISASLGEVPTATAKQVLNACNTDALAVKYATPVEGTATFKRPKVTSELVTEDGGGLWDISISMDTDTILCDGL